MHAQEDKYCFRHRFFHPYMESSLILRRLSVTDVFPRIFMNSDMELNQISVDIVTPTQDVSMSPISLVLFIRRHKNGRYVTMDSRARLLKSKLPLFEKYPRELIRALQQIASYEGGGPQHVFCRGGGRPFMSC